MVRSVAASDQLAGELSASEVVAVLRDHFPELAEQFHVSSLALFGSFARQEQTPSSDVDLLVGFSKPVGFEFMHLAQRLEALLRRPVDLVAVDGIKPNRRASIFEGLIHVAP